MNERDKLPRLVSYVLSEFSYEIKYFNTKLFYVMVEADSHPRGRSYKWFNAKKGPAQQD